MRYDQNGLSLWYGTPDAPAPEGDVLAAANGRVTGLAVAVAVHPIGARNTVEVRYRVNGGGGLKLQAPLAHIDVRSNAQYFIAHLPEFRVGDNVEYIAVALSPGSQIPNPTQAATYSSSFHVVSSLSQAQSPPTNPNPASAISNPGPALAHRAPPATGATAGKGPYKVNGYIFFEYGLPATGVTLRLYNRGFGNALTKLAEMAADINGYYSFAYDVHPGMINLDLHALSEHGKEISLCEPKHRMEKNEVLNLVAPTSLFPVSAEFDRFAADVAKALGSFDKLAGAHEDNEHHDLTFVCNITGWDARLVALGATASQLAGESGMPPGALYALFRAGLPLDKHQLARTHIDEVEAAFKVARDANIVHLDDRGIASAKAAFEKFAFATLHESTAAGSVSSFRELLSHTGLTAAQQSAFAQLFFSQGSNSEGLWQKAEALGIPKDKIALLQLQGKLFYLTLNNAPLALELQNEVGTLANLSKLVDSDLHQPEQWKIRLKKIAGNSDRALAALIPSTYGAENTEERLDAYSADLARRIRMSYPTHVVARMLEAGHLAPQTPSAADATQAAALLRAAADLGFKLGQTPVEAFLAKNKQQLQINIKPEELHNAIDKLKHLHRLHQITPSDESLQGLYALGLRSAHAISRLPYDAFIRRYGHVFPSSHEADLVYRKSQQVTSTTLNFYSMAKSAANSPGVFAMSPPAHRREASKQNLIKHYPTMETLFGSLDFCECKDCRSILSPAAYLVDLLHFLDPSHADWDHFLADWRSKHNNTPYPFHDHQAHLLAEQGQKSRNHRVRAAAVPKTPYEVFVERRPDIPNLPLTCENTNTVMPYIDIVNEVLEYFVVHDSLAPNSGHDTGNASTDELIAEPQNLLPAAYDKLRLAQYPLNLPFDLWLATVRHFLAHFDVTLAEILELFRTSDDLYTPQTNPKAYGWSDIFIESLGLSPSEYALFTDPSILTRWYTLYGYANEHDATSALASAKTLADSLSVSYLDLVAIVTTGFVNPAFTSLVLLSNLAVDPEEVLRYKKAPKYKPFSHSEETAFEQRLADKARLFGASEADAKSWLDKAWQGGSLDRVLVLADPDSSCKFDQATLRYLNATPADTGVFLRINLFVRLWKALQWNIDELDRALQVFLPNSGASATSLAPAFKTGLLYLSHLTSLDKELKLGRNARQKLLTLWSNLPTTGKNPLYAQLFLKRSILKTDPAFDDPAGNYLSDPAALLIDHLLAIQGALNLTASEVTEIVTDAGLDPATAPLSLALVSLLYRYGLLAKALKISVHDLIALKVLSGLDPFKALKPGSVATLSDDYPFSQTMRFVELARTVKASGFHVEDLAYLLRHQFDPVGKYRENPAKTAGLVKLIASGLRALAAEHAIPADASTLTDDLLQQKLSLVLPGDAVTAFVGMWNATIQYDVMQSNVQSSNKLDPAAFASFPAITVTYDTVLQAQKLSYRGVLTDAQAAAIQKPNASPLLANLLKMVSTSVKNFYSKYLSSFLSSDSFQSLFDSATLDPAKTSSRRGALAQQLFPYIQTQLSRQFVTQSLASALGADPSLVQTLTCNSELLNDPAEPDKKLADRFFSLTDSRFDTNSYASNDGSGSPIGAAGSTSASPPTQGQPPGNPNSVRYDGYFEVPVTGPYRFYAQIAKSGANAELCLDFLPDPLIQASASSDQAELSGAVDLKGGVPYRFSFEANNLAGGTATLLVQGESLPKSPLSQLVLYAKSAVDSAGRNFTLLAKSLELITKLPLNEREIRYLLAQANAPDFAGLSFSALPTAATDDTPAKAAALFARFIRLANYARLKNEIVAGSDDLIGIFENAQRVLAATDDPTKTQTALVTDLCSRIGKLARRETLTVSKAILQLAFSPASKTSAASPTVWMPDLRQEKGLQKLWRVLQVVEKVGGSADALARWATPSPDAKIAQDLRNGVKARYEPENWLVIATPIFDKLRRLQRDALVSYIMFHNGFLDKDELFDYFLLDPGMEPVVQTSRMRLAISCLQTFIQRCLLNLEPQVQPSALSSDQWEWVKQYRVWQANREIFLFPENWLEPEFRDDKTDLFQELEGSLLQGDVSNDLAEDALFTYLQKLEEIARLEIVSMCCDEDPLDPGSNTLHIIARTKTNPRKYFYRTYAHQMWTPWQAISTTIDGDHIVSVIWHNRLNLFWLTFMDQPPPQSSGSADSSQPDGSDQTTLKDMKLSDLHKATRTTPPPKVVQVHLNWIEYFQGKWSAPASSGGSDGDGDSGDSGSSGSVGHPLGVTVASDFEKSTVSVHATVEHTGETEAALIHLNFPWVQYSWFSPSPPMVTPKGRTKIIIPRPLVHPWGPWHLAFKLIDKHRPPDVVNGMAPIMPPFPHTSYGMTHYKGTNPFQVQYLERIQTVDNQPPKDTYTLQNILRHDGTGAGNTHQLTALGMPLHAQTPEVGVLVSPFFFSDTQNTFYVEPSLTETTIDVWEHWAIPLRRIVPRFHGTPHPTKPRMVASFPRYIPPHTLPANVKPFTGRFDPSARYHIQVKHDVVTDERAELRFAGHIVGSSGATGVAKPRQPVPGPKPAGKPARGARR
jgi:hypothetical protein